MRSLKSRFCSFFGGMVLVVGLATPSAAISIQTVQFTSDGGAAPVWGQSLTINVGATIPDAMIPAVVDLDLVGFRTGDPNIGSADRTSVYLHIYDDFTITAGGAVATVGTLLAVSINSLNLETAAPSTGRAGNRARMSHYRARGPRARSANAG